MNKDILLKLAIYFGMDKSTNFGIRYSIVFTKEPLRRLRLHVIFYKVFKKLESSAIKNMIQTCMYKKLIKQHRMCCLLLNLF